MSEWIDISIPLSGATVVWPGDPPLQIQRISDMEHGAGSNLTSLTMSVHSGTHVDAPLHFLRQGASVDRLGLSAMVGVARVIQVGGRPSVSRHELETHRIRKGERLLFRTANSRRAWDSKPFDHGYVHLSADAAEYLAGRKVRLVGVDYLSVASMEDAAFVHRILLKAGICIVEGLDLRAVCPGSYDLVCLPLRIAGAEGAPARAILRSRSRRTSNEKRSALP